MKTNSNGSQGTPAPAAPADLSPAALRAYYQIISGNVHAFYSSYSWQQLAAAARARDRNECQDCRRRGLYAPAAAVHHIEFILNNPARALDLNNLVCLCAACHDQRHGYRHETTAAAGRRYQNAERW